jgi:hypothetical protein
LGTAIVKKSDGTVGCTLESTLVTTEAICSLKLPNGLSEGLYVSTDYIIEVSSGNTLVLKSDFTRTY